MFDQSAKARRVCTGRTQPDICRSRPVTVSEGCSCTLFSFLPLPMNCHKPKRSRTQSEGRSGPSLRPVERDYGHGLGIASSGGWTGGNRYLDGRCLAPWLLHARLALGLADHCNQACDSRACKEPCQDSHLIRLVLPSFSALFCLSSSSSARPEISSTPAKAPAALCGHRGSKSRESQHRAAGCRSGDLSHDH